MSSSNTNRPLSKQLCNCHENECHPDVPPGWQCRKKALTSKQLTRYCISAGPNGRIVLDISEDPEGNWVEYEDVEAEIERLRAALTRLRRWAVLNIAVTPANEADLPEWRETIKEVEAALSGEPSSVETTKQPDPYVSALAEAGIRAERDRRIIDRHVRWRERAMELLRQVERGYEGEWPELAEFIKQSDSRISPSSSEETNEHSVKGLASAGSSAAVNPRDTVDGSAEPSGRPDGEASARPSNHFNFACESFIPDPHSNFCDRCGYRQHEHKRAENGT